MMSTKTRAAVCLLAGLFSGPLLAECGQTPSIPVIPDGATAAMEELVTASREVKAFIADADAYLDCRETAMNSDEYGNLSVDDKSAWTNEIKELTESRNSIGDEFNAQVMAYKEANPEN